MLTFPTLSSTPLVQGYGETAAIDPTIRSPKEGGYVQTRPKFTRIPGKWSIVYPKTMTDADYNTLKAFEVSVAYGADSFYWTNPKTSVQHIVRFGPPVFYGLGETSDYWFFDFELYEV